MDQSVTEVLARINVTSLVLSKLKILGCQDFHWLEQESLVTDTILGLKAKGIFDRYAAENSQVIFINNLEYEKLNRY
jgi:hypothetical protein